MVFIINYEYSCKNMKGLLMQMVGKVDIRLTSIGTTLPDYPLEP